MRAQKTKLTNTGVAIIARLWWRSLLQDWCPTADCIAVVRFCEEKEKQVRIHGGLQPDISKYMSVWACICKPSPTQTPNVFLKD